MFQHADRDNPVELACLPAIVAKREGQLAGLLPVDLVLLGMDKLLFR